jgi:hypothetical protein
MRVIQSGLRKDLQLSVFAMHTRISIDKLRGPRRAVYIKYHRATDQMVNKTMTTTTARVR